jgi:hypothetical protein
MSNLTDHAFGHYRLITIIGLALLVVLQTAGCASFRSAGAPPPSYDVDEDLKQLAEHFKPATSVENFYNNPTKNKRDEVISARLVMINLEYLKWLRTITADKQLLDTATDVLVMSVNLAATATTGATAKTILSAVAAGVTGTKTSIDKNYYYEKTLPAIVAAMNAQRKQVLVRILEGMKQDKLEDYTFEVALADVYEYYQAGSFMGAIMAIQADSGAKESKADEEIKSIRTVTYSKDEAGVLLKKFWMPDGKNINKDNEKKLKEKMQSRGLSTGPGQIQTFIVDKNMAPLRALVVGDLGLSE